MQLEVKDYSLSDVKKGLILIGLDEIMQILDDSAMSLQSMSGSQFATPFLKGIRALEKEISLASEVIETWLTVQRKWLQLESVFTGIDIHTRIPREVEKFQKLNSAFKQAGRLMRCLIDLMKGKGLKHKPSLIGTPIG